MMMRKFSAAGILAGVLALAQAGTLAAQGQYSYQTRPSRFVALTGTFQLDRSRSDDPYRVADQALRQVAAAERDRVSRRLTARLDPPDVLALDRSGTQIRMASSRAPEMSFVADGRARVEQGAAGRRTTTRASVIGERLEVSTRSAAGGTRGAAAGAAGTDFTVTFEPMDRNTLRVTRRLFDERLRQPVVVQSVYRRVSDTADWDVYDGYATDARSGRYTQYDPYDPNDRNDRYDPNDPYDPSRPTDYRSTSIDRLLPVGSTLIANLDQSINARARQDERITMTVSNAPRPELEGAVIEGRVAPQSINGRTGLTIAFDQIRLRDGRTADFAGTIDAVRGVNGEAIDYNGEQIDAGRDQTQQAIQRGAIGAAIGAIIGAVAGGGKGAAVGAVIGGGGGAATVFLDPQNQSTLERGTEFTIRTQRR